MRKKLYIFALIILILTFGLLIFFRVNKPNTTDKAQVAKTIIPIVENKTISNDSKIISNTTASTNIKPKTVIELKADESLVDIYNADLNSDGAEDQLIATKKISDPHIYIIPAIQNLVFQKYARNEILKTEITQPNTLSMYTLDLGLDKMPAVVCSGMTSDNKQMLMIFFPTKYKDGNLKFRQIADLRADIQIIIQANKASNKSGLNMYEINTFDSDTTSPKTLTQIKKVYTWDSENERYIKSKENLIPGEKVEDQMLRKLGSGNVKLFKEFINGLWIQPESSSDGNRSLYFDNTNDEIIFFLDNIQEAYEIETAKQRRYGLYIRAHNKSISNIILRVDIEIKSVDEITVRVVENVAHIKISTSSLWNGIYRKKDDSINNQISISKKPKLTIAEKLLNQPNTVWKNNDYELIVKDRKFNFKTPYGVQTGFLTISSIKETTILQMRGNMTERAFTLQNSYDKEKQKDSLILNEINLKLKKIEPLDNPPIILEYYPLEKEDLEN